MPRGLTHILRLLTLAAPGAAFAIGLGDIRVESALNEPLSAQIEIVSATPEELQELSAAIASRDTFQRYGAERPAFLASARFRVSQDSHGRPVLQVSSSEAFNEPVVSLLVDLRWHKGELIREYPLLLDPAGFASAAPAAPSRPVAARGAAIRIVPAPVGATADAPITSDSVTESPTQPPVAAGDTAARPRRYAVSKRDTLGNIARRVSASRDRLMLQRTMIAIFRANPSAFDGNINRLHRGATLTIPTADDVARIAANDARTEVRAQMLAWRRKDASAPTESAQAATRVAPSTPAPDESTRAGELSQASSQARSLASRSAEPASPSPADAAAAEAAPSIRAATAALAGGTLPAKQPASGQQSSSDAALARRIDSLEQALDDTKRLLSSEHKTLQSLQQYVAEAASPYPVPPPSPPVVHDKAPAESAEPAQPRLSTGAVLGLVGGALFIVLVIVWRSRAKRAPIPAKFPSVPQENFADVFAEPLKVPEIKTSGAAPVPSAAIALRRAASPPPAAPSPPRKAPPAAAANPSASPPQSTVSAAPAPEADEDEDGDTTVSVAVGSEIGDDTVNLAGPTERIAVDTARLAALNELERELERSYDPTETGVIDPSYAPTSSLATTRVNAAGGAASAATTQRLAQSPGSSATPSTGATAQHVQMPSKLSERAVVEQERMNIVEILRKAIEQDPHRLDLRLKLLELYFSSGLSNRDEFVEVARKLSRSGEVLSAADWQKISALGSPAAAGKLADCA